MRFHYFFLRAHEVGEANARKQTRRQELSEEKKEENFHTPSLPISTIFLFPFVLCLRFLYLQVIHINFISQTIRIQFRTPVFPTQLNPRPHVLSPRYSWSRLSIRCCICELLALSDHWFIELYSLSVSRKEG